MLLHMNLVNKASSVSRFYLTLESFKISMGSYKKPVRQPNLSKISGSIFSHINTKPWKLLLNRLYCWVAISWTTEVDFAG